MIKIISKAYNIVFTATDNIKMIVSSSYNK